MNPARFFQVAASAIVLSCFPVLATNAADQAPPPFIWLDVKINSQPARFVFDTGAGGLTIMRGAAERLGLKVTKINWQPPLGMVAVGWTEKCHLTLWNSTTKTRLAWWESGLDLSLDGTIGWPSVNKRIFSIDAATRSVKFLDRVPQEAASWTKLRVQPDCDVLNLEIPGPEGKTAVIFVDTGATWGLALNPHKWAEWKTAHTNQPMTLEGAYTGPLGFFVAEESWAREIKLGPLELTDVPVQGVRFPSPASAPALRTAPAFTLCLAAMNQMDMIVDGKHNVAYLRPKRTPPLPCAYNRLGAAFVPLDLKSDDLVAFVADSSPAYEAGVRNGDVLLAIDGHDMTKWRANGKLSYPFRDQPVGTRLNLTLKRGDRILTTTAVLRDILAPDPTKPPNA
jgi:hypothetical protein